MIPPKKSPSNPLLAATTNFSLEQSFGIQQPALLIPSAASQEQQQTQEQRLLSSQMHQIPDSEATGFLGDDDKSMNDPLLSSFNMSGRDLPPLANPVASTIAPPTPVTNPPTMNPSVEVSQHAQPLGPPPSGVFLLPGAKSTTTSVAGSENTYSLSSGSRKNRYVAPPGINSSSPMTMESLMPSGVPQSSIHQTPFQSNQFNQSAVLDVTSNTATQFGAPSALSPAFDQSELSSFKSDKELDDIRIVYHWFYMIKTSNDQEQWKPFSMIDSTAIEDIYNMDRKSTKAIPTDGGRFDVYINERKKVPVYWKGEALPIRRASWFYKSNNDGRWTPYQEDIAKLLEKEYLDAYKSDQWNRKIQIGEDEHVSIHSPTVILHFPSKLSSMHSGNLDDWGQVQPQDLEIKPKIVHRGLEGLPDIPDGEGAEIDHLVFVVHGIGAACDIKFRSINEVVDGFRSLTSDLTERHFQSSHLAGRVNRIEYLPINWHDTLHGEDTGTDNRLKPLTLKSIPKLRNFVNDTLLDILFYTSPVFCQTILNTVVSEINRIYTMFMVRNDNFKGSISVMGHSLGSLILFDVLTHQTPDLHVPRHAKSQESDALLTRRLSDENLDLVGLFSKLEITEFANTFINEGIDIDSLMTCTEEDLKEVGLPEEARKKLLTYIEHRGKENHQPTESDGLDEFQRHSVTENVKYQVGPAGTGQPSILYPRLCFEPQCFYALGSPIALFLAVRGIDSLGENFKFPTCSKFFNIFHPYDPVAYRVESLINLDYSKLRPVVIPHHKGRKRMHLELKDTVTRLMTTDIKQKIFDSVSATLSTVYNIATGTSQPTMAKALEDSMSKQAVEEEEADKLNPRSLNSALNSGKRIDFVLQEAPFESFNEYLFALASHLCYWESEDTCLMVVKDIYAQTNIYSDDENQTRSAFNTGYNGPKVDSNPTPILAPPPVPIGGTMAGPPVLQTSNSTPILAPPPVPMGGTMAGPPTLKVTGATPILAPPPVPMGGTMQGPPVLITKPSNSETPEVTKPKVVPSNIDLAQTSEVSKIPLMTPTVTASFNLSNSPGTPSDLVYSTPLPSINQTNKSQNMFGGGIAGPSPIGAVPPIGPPSIKPSPFSKPTHRLAYPNPNVATAPRMGMDPTAPVMRQSAAPLPPPPTTGFYNNQ